MIKTISNTGSFVEALVEQSPDALIALSSNNKILFWNHGAETIFGFSKEEAVEQSLDDLIVPPEYRQQSQTAFEQVLSIGTAFFETTRKRKDGSNIEVGVSMRVVKDEQDKVQYIVVSKKDITHFKLMHETHASELKFRGLLEAAPDAMVILGKDGRITLINAQTEALFGYKRDELIGQTIEILVPERFRDKHPGHRTGYFSTPKARPMGAGLDLFGRRKDGSEFAAEISLSPIRTSEGVLVTAAIRDVTDRKRDLEERNRRMQEANRLKSEFLANMSHELRTPLNAIIGFAALMHSGKAGPLLDAQKEYLNDILTSSRHLLQLINDVLDLAKVESGRMDFKVEQIDLKKLLGEVKDILRGLSAEKRIHIIIDIDPTLDMVSLDPRMLKQVLYNYLSNAIKFTHENSQVIVRLLPQGKEHFRIEVEDTGIGIQPENINKLFIEFQQLDASSAKKYPGTGLGLALTKRIVEAQGGSVAVKSVPNEGSTFSAILPLEMPVQDVKSK